MNRADSNRLAFREGVALFAVALLACALSGRVEASTFRLQGLCSDGMVLQRGRPAFLHGIATPGTRVALEVRTGPTRVSTRVRPDGTWTLRFAPPSAEGPHELIVTAADTVVTLRDVLVGEVWLCSGQSNMEMPLEGWPPGSPVAGSDSAIAAASDPGLRLFTVERAFASRPRADLAGTWRASDPASARRFSATAYFFGRSLRAALGVPVGLVVASWGGTPVEAWTSPAALAADSATRAALRWVEVGEDTLAARERWLLRHPVREIDSSRPGMRWEDVTLTDEDCARADLDDSAWRTLDVPGDWEDRGLGPFDGVVWYRKHVTIPQSWVGRPLTLRLGPVDDMDVTYVNGRRVGGLMGDGHWRTPRQYAIPDSLVSGRELVIAVRVVDFVGGGGPWGDGNPVDLHAGDPAEALSLAGPWRALPVAEYVAPRLYDLGGAASDFGARPHLPIELNASAPGVLYNGMIAPLAPYAFRGVAWYQGESNVRSSGTYAARLRALVADWRRAFADRALSFGAVQIAPYAYGPGEDAPGVREAQRLALRTAGTGMIVTLDVGDERDIHPRHKREVGERLAAWALATNYGREVPWSGPVLESLRRAGAGLELRFASAGDGLVFRPAAGGSEFEVAGADGRFEAADARVERQTLVLTSAGVPEPLSARYAFRNAPAATLFDASGLPASPFVAGPAR